MGASNKKRKALKPPPGGGLVSQARRQVSAMRPAIQRPVRKPDPDTSQVSEPKTSRQRPVAAPAASAQTPEDPTAAADSVPWPKPVGDFWQSPHPVLVRAAEHPDTAPETLSRLSRATSQSLRAAVAAHPHLPSKDITRLSRSSDYEIRSTAAANPGCSPRVLSRLSKEPDHRVVAGVARNPMCPPKLLSEMVARKPMWGWNHVLAAVAAHPNTSAETLQRLHDYSTQELRRLAGSDPYSEDAYDPGSEFYDPDGEDRMYSGNELVWCAEVIQRAVGANPGGQGCCDAA